MADGRLADRVVIVTGASRGIGKAIALACAHEGAAVAVTARTEAEWDPRLPGTVYDTVAEIEADGGRAIAIPADLARPDDVDRIVEVAARRARADRRAGEQRRGHGARPAARARSAPPPAPAAAGGPGGDRRAPAPRPGSGSFLDFPLKGFRLHFEVGLFASYRLMQLVLPDMIAAGRGAIVNISSLAGFIPGEGPYEHAGRPGPIAYGGNKAALHHLTQAVAIEMAPFGIAVNVLSPSEPVITPGNLVAAAGETNWASPEEFAEATVRVALADPATTTGQLLWSDDVLHPELGRRGWLR